MPSRSFRQESSVYLYYDVYNLLRGANGRTRYRVDYEARGGGPDAARRLFERIARFLGRDEDRKITRISYEHEGFQGSEPLCVTLDLSAKSNGDVEVHDTVTITVLKGLHEPSVSRHPKLNIGD